MLHRLLVALGIRAQVLQARVIITQEPDGSRGEEDDGTGLFHERLATLHGAQVDVRRSGAVVGRQLHDKGRVAAAEEVRLAQHEATDDHRPEARAVGDGGRVGIPAQQGGYQRDDGDFGTAGHEGGEHHGHAAVFLVLDGAGGHDARHAAAHTHQQRDERFAGEADGAEDAVHHERHAGHVAAVLQQGEQQEEHRHLRQEAQHRSHTGYYAVADEGRDLFTACQLCPPQEPDAERNGTQDNEPDREFRATAASADAEGIAAETLCGVPVGIGTAVPREAQADEQKQRIRPHQQPEQAGVQPIRSVRADVFQHEGGQGQVEP